MEAAYLYGDEWLEQLLDYLQGNLDYVMKYFVEKIPRIRVIEPQGTYLVWLDCRKLDLSPEELEQMMVEKAGVYLDEGYIFGEEGAGYERINIACPRPLLQEALERMHHFMGRYG